MAKDTIFMLQYSVHPSYLLLFLFDFITIYDAQRIPARWRAWHHIIHPHNIRSLAQHCNAEGLQHLNVQFIVRHILFKPHISISSITLHHTCVHIRVCINQIPELFLFNPHIHCSAPVHIGRHEAQPLSASPLRMYLTQN